MVRVLVGGLLGLAVLGLVGGYLGALHPMGDSLAVGRAYAAVGVLLAAGLVAAVGLRWMALAGAVVGLVAGVQVFRAYTVAGPEGDLLVYQKNMLFRNAELAALEADIRAADPLVVTLQEVSEPNLALLGALKDLLPHQLYCPFAAVGGTAVATALPPVRDNTICAPGLAAMQVDFDGKRLWLVSVHLHWPWPYGQANQIAALLPVLEGLKGPVVMAGDFNMVVWAHGVNRLATVTRTKAAGSTAGTYLGFDPWLRLPIDHVFAPLGGHVTLRRALGSDHLGLLAEVGL